ncbi:hypothetical protein CRG98_001972 [Punica granatum]|uniref:Uncharacterized protein n=1 Tax=Punica granatum TaxID=22663 RepID=A0A2I0LAB5_PUNGR|nr:hypothetical protein CRG98_001972 [Punica granatum]
MSRCVSGAYRLGRDTPDLSQTPFLTGLLGPVPLTYRHPGTTEVVEQASDDLSELYGAPRGTLRKPRSQVPRSSRANGLRSGTTSQQSPKRQKAHRDKHYNAQRSNRRTETVNSTLNAQTGQNRLSKRRVTRTFVHTTYGDIRLIQILFVQAFQIY